MKTDQAPRKLRKSIFCLAAELARFAGSNEQSQPQACHDNTAASVDGATFVSAMLCATTLAAALSVLALRSSSHHSNEPSDDDDSWAVCVCFCVRSRSSHAIYTC